MWWFGSGSQDGKNSTSNFHCKYSVALISKLPSPEQLTYTPPCRVSKCKDDPSLPGFPAPHSSFHTPTTDCKSQLTSVWPQSIYLRTLNFCHNHSPGKLLAVIIIFSWSEGELKWNDSPVGAGKSRENQLIPSKTWDWKGEGQREGHLEGRQCSPWLSRLLFYYRRNWTKQFLDDLRLSAVMDSLVNLAQLRITRDETWCRIVYTGLACRHVCGDCLVNCCGKTQPSVFWTVSG